MPADERIQKNAGADVQIVHQVYFMGDSLTTHSPYYDTVGALLGSSWGVVNNGIGGDTTHNMLKRFSTDITSHADCEYVVILGGINNIFLGESAASIESDLQAMYTAAHDARIKVVAVSITPSGSFPEWGYLLQTVLDDVNTWILSTAINVDYFIDAYSVLEDPENPNALLPIYDNGDHVHLSTAGYELLGRTVYYGVIWIERNWELFLPLVLDLY